MTALADTAGNTDVAVTRSDFAHVLCIPTRWMDNDIYGHVNNVVYYAYFDTVINQYLIEHGGLDIHAGEVIGYAVESHCRYLRPLAFPQRIDAGLRVSRIGTSSVHYEIGLFPEGEQALAAMGRFVHVFVRRTDQRPTPLPDAMRAALARIAVPGESASVSR